MLHKSFEIVVKISADIAKVCDRNKEMLILNKSVKMFNNREKKTLNMLYIIKKVILLSVRHVRCYGMLMVSK